MSDAEELERRLMPKKAKGTPDEFWLLATHRSRLAEGAEGPGRENQHLALAALFAGRGFRAGERDPKRIADYLAIFRRAQSKGCFPADLQSVLSRITSELRLASGASEPKVLRKKAKTVFTHVAMYLISDAAAFDAISNDRESWSDDKGMKATVRAGRGLFIYTGSDGSISIEIRMIDRDELVLMAREYKNLTSSTDPALLAVRSGVIRVGQPGGSAAECLDLEVEPGVYRAVLYDLSNGEKCILVATRTGLEDATNNLPETAERYGQSSGGILCT